LIVLAFLKVYAMASAVLPRMKKAASVPSRPRTFRSSALEQDFIAFCQLNSHKLAGLANRPTPKELLASLEEHVTGDDFATPGFEKALCGSVLLLPLAQGEATSPSATRTAGALGQLCEVRLLSPEEERSAFLRMNYFKFLGARILTQRVLTEWDIERAAGLLEAATWHRDLLIKANMRLVVSIVKKIANPQNPFDELLSDGIIALMRAVDKFDAGRGFRFSTYATQVVRRECYHQIYQRQQDRSRYISSELGDGLDALPEPLTSTADQERWLAWRERLGQLLPNLSRREQVIIRSRFCLGAHRQVQTLQRLAELLGISKERVRQLEQRAMVKLRQMVEPELLPMGVVEDDEAA
jgi:RNA polymerase primary sigma factor